jgi:hypothetical protein
VGGEEPILETVADRYAATPFLILPTQDDKRVAIFALADL